jgi:hypothetical protein
MADLGGNGPQDGRLRPDSAADVALKQRRIKTYLQIGFFVVVLGPIVLGLLGTLLFSVDGFGIFGFVFFSIAALLGFLVPILVPVVLVGGIGWAIYSHHRGRSSPLGETGRALVPRNLGSAVASIQSSIRSASAVQQIAARREPVAVHERATVDVAEHVAVLETLRAEAAARTSTRIKTFVPLALVGVVLFWWGLGFGQGGTGSPIMGFLIMACIAGTFAWMYAVNGPSDAYAKAFKERLMPRLLGAYGDLGYAPGEAPPLDRYLAVGLLPRHDRVTAEDEIRGTYRGHAVRLCELQLVKTGRKTNWTLFQGLLVEVDVATPFAGTTLVVDNTVGAARPGGAENLARVRLDDPLFDEVYQVYADDEAGARAVLTPDAMERLLVMADSSGFAPPFLLFEGGHMAFAVKRLDGKNLFEPPSLSSHVAAEQLASQQADIAAVFGLLDAIIAMEEARPAGGPTGSGAPRRG